MKDTKRKTNDNCDAIYAWLRSNGFERFTQQRTSGSGDTVKKVYDRGMLDEIDEFDKKQKEIKKP
jgi:hypothetical protein